ncbi:MAG TPA: VWA domain-containing protein [Cytophagaceae bacterium]|jgi:Ca-activated chloride channel family protein
MNHFQIYFKKLFLPALIVFVLFSCDQEKAKHKQRDATTEVTSESQPIPNDKTGNKYVIKSDQVNEELPDEKLAIEHEQNASSPVMREQSLDEVVSIGYATRAAHERKADNIQGENYNTEAYSLIQENEFLASKENPLSTFSIDVDAASYSNSRRFLNNGSLPPADAVRVEEFINYFSYDYPQPKGKDRFAIVTEVSECPWNEAHQLVHIGLQGKKIPFNEIAPINLVFLIDVSGSMDEVNKLPLLKKSFKLLVSKMRAKDRIAMVVYAGAAGLVLPSTSGAQKETILQAIDQLNAGGSTAGGEGIKLAYKIAKENMTDNGQNRVILATDGDFNIGVSSDGEMTRLVEEKSKDGIYLTVLGFGMGNYKDSKMESMADHGNGNYFYIDDMNEAKKVLVDELDGTLYTIAKDVKIQVEFNPAKVKGYRLVGYENRMLKKEDFNDDKKDAGELGAGHTVTALYEIIAATSKEELNGKVDGLKYQKPTATVNNYGSELMTVKLRYKNPEESASKLIVETLTDKNVKLESASNDFRFSAAVASFGLLLRDSKFKGKANYDTVIELATQSKAKDDEGHRAEFLKLVKMSQLLANDARSSR